MVFALLLWLALLGSVPGRAQQPGVPGWNAMNGPVSGQFGTDGTVWALAVMGTDVYVAGSFSQVGGIAARNIARWDGTAWRTLGTGPGNGIPGEVRALAVAGTNLYVAGGVALAGNNVARWDGTAWSSLGTGPANGVNDVVYALAVVGSDVYVGGQFTQAGGAPANRIAKWNGATWIPLSTGSANGVNGRVLAIAGTGADVYVGGDFTTAGGTVANKIARWDGGAWNSVGTGADNGIGANSTDSQVNALALIGPNLYVGGFFTRAGTVNAGEIARWDGTAWASIGGTSHYVTCLAVAGSDLYVGGTFSSVGVSGIRANNVAKWNGTAWSSLGTGSRNNGVSAAAYALAAVGSTDVYVGGLFTEAGDGSFNGLPLNTVGYYRYAGTPTARADAPANAPATIFPNPATRVAYVPHGGAAATLTLRNALGQVVRTVVLPAGARSPCPVALAGLVPGGYVMRLQTETGVVVQKLVVE